MGEMVNMPLNQKHLYEWYRQIVEHTSQGMMVTDADSRILFVNQAFTTITGYSKDEVLGKTPRLWRSGRHGELFYAQLWESLLRTGQWQGEIWNRKKDGTVYPQRLHIDAVKDESGQIANYVALFSDISEQKMIECELQQREEQYRFIAENCSDIIATISADGTLVYVSPACRYLLGYEPEELLGRSVFEWIERNEDQQLLPRSIETGGAFHILTFCFRFRKKDGTKSWFETTVRKLGGGKGMIAVVRDITLRKEAEEQLKKANDLLQRMLSLDGLTGIANRRSFDELLAREWESAKQQNAPLALIMIDIDAFKRFNDTYGHQCGDDCLRKVALSLEQTAKQYGGAAARYGGEEFAVILPHASPSKAAAAAEAIRLNIEGLAIPHRLSPAANCVTVSVGAAVAIPQPNEHAEALLSLADQALYRAKQNGRNRVEIACPARG